MLREIEAINVLVVIPHFTILSPQGARERLDGFVSLLAAASFEIQYLVPDRTPAADVASLGDTPIHFFAEPTLGPLAIPHLLDSSPSFVTRLLAVVEREQIDLVVFNFPWGASRAAASLPVPAVILSHGIEREFAGVALRRFRADILPLRLVFRALVARLERRATNAASLTFAISERDRGALVSLYDVDPTCVIALRHPVQQRSPGPRARSRARCQFADGELIGVFIGTWGHAPNREAITAIVERIAPAIAKRHPELRFVIAGAGVPEFTRSNVRALGFVEDLDELLDGADFAVNPMFSGAGIRMKLFEYIAAGLPLVTTRMGATGIDLTPDVHALVTDNSIEAFVEAVDSLAASPALRSSLAQSALEWLKVHHDPRQLAEEVAVALAPLVNRSSGRKSPSARLAR